MKPGLKLFGLPTQEYKNKVGSTVFEISGTLNELRSIYKDIRNNYLRTKNTPFDIPDGRVLYIKHCHAITNMMEVSETMVIRIITSPEPIISKAPKGDEYKIYL
jgi:hypothetical protein